MKTFKGISAVWQGGDFLQISLRQEADEKGEGEGAMTYQLYEIEVEGEDVSLNLVHSGPGKAECSQKIEVARANADFERAKLALENLEEAAAADDTVAADDGDDTVAADGGDDTTTTF